VLSKAPWIQCGRKRIRWDILHESSIGLPGSSSENWSYIIRNEEDDGEQMEVTHAIDGIESEEEEDEKSQSSSENWSGLTSSEEEYGPPIVVTDVIEENERRRRAEAESEENSDHLA
jgi:hypothetical protein